MPRASPLPGSAGRDKQQSRKVGQEDTTMSDTATTAAPKAATAAIGKFAAVGIGVADMDRSVKFYTEVMGMKQLQVFDLPHMKEVIVGYKGDIAIALMHFIDGSNPNYTNN